MLAYETILISRSPEPINKARSATLLYGHLLEITVRVLAVCCTTRACTGEFTSRGLEGD